MNSKERREVILNKLSKSSEPIKGSNLAEELNVTRQIIVKDIAIIRASGNKIIATPSGYIIEDKRKAGIDRVLALKHEENQIEDELSTIIKYGGIIKDVIVEHPLYGEIKGNLMIKTQFDIINFINKMNKSKAEPLMKLTKGVHLHTVEAENEEIMARIIKELEEKKYLVTD